MKCRDEGARSLWRMNMVQSLRFEGTPNGRQRKRRALARRRHKSTRAPKPRLGILLLLLLTKSPKLDRAEAFRVVDENGTTKPFLPFENDFVGRYGDPFTTYVSDRVNEGAPGTPTYPRLYEGVYPRQICPGMVGPVEDRKYYCLSKEHGYCDRRSGTCFCNLGYQGISCQECSSTHYSEGGLCYPKLLCPNDCSGAGTCHYSNGTCSCLLHRVGNDCSSPFCSAMFSDLCKECTFKRCTACDSGYYVDEVGGGYDCLPCDRYDPRCTRCNDETCLECTDPLLLSTRRSGMRRGDPPLPFDEIERELPHALEFGTKEPRYFASAEAFHVVAEASSPLNESSMACAQGLLGDDSWQCESKRISHRVCGNPGTISFSSPEYRGFENPYASVSEMDNDYYGYYFQTNGTVRLTVVRTGGGYGFVGVKYGLRHVTTDDADVTAHAHYTASNSLVFDEGVVELSFLVGIHEDGRRETIEKFDVFLYNPWGGARLGSQQRARVEIVDAESNGTTTVATLTTLHYDGDGDGGSGTGSVVEMGAIAGTVGNVTVVARDALGRARRFGGDLFAVWVEGREEGHGDNEKGALSLAAAAASSGIPIAVGEAAAARVAEDLGSGNYSASFKVDVAGRYSLRIALCRPGGLTGRYFSDSFFAVEEFQRVDRVMNFSWGSGAITKGATDFAGVVWTGRIRPDHSGIYALELGTASGGGDAARLWIDGKAIVDGFERGWGGAEEGLAGGGRGYANLTAGTLHYVRIEYSERRGDASLYLAWSSSGVPYQITPPHNLYWCQELGDSPRPFIAQSAATHAKKSEAFGVGTVSTVAGVPSTLTIVPRDEFGNLRVDETDPDVLASDRFSVVLEAVDYDIDNDVLGGVHGAAGSGGKVVTGTVEFVPEDNVFSAEYLPFVAGTHLLNVTFQERLFEPETHVKGSPFTVRVTPGEAFGRRCDAWGEALRNGTAGVTGALAVQARDVVGNIISKGGSELAVHAFHREVQAYVVGATKDLGNGTYSGSLMPTIAGPYRVFVALDNQEVADSPYPIVVTPGNAHGPSSSAYGAGVTQAVATIENTIFVQARDAWGNNLWGPHFNVTVDIFPAAEEAIAERTSEFSSVSFFGNGSGIATAIYVPTQTGASLLRVRVDGLEVSGSPFHIDVSGGPARGSNATASGTALVLATTGRNSSFTIQARDREANPTGGHREGTNTFDVLGKGQGTVFNVTLTKHESDSGREEGRNNATTVAASVEYIAGCQQDVTRGPLRLFETTSETGAGRYRATYNATKSGNYSLEVVDVSDGEHAVGSPFEVFVEPSQAFSPATLVWWDWQVAGSNVIHLQAVDFWGNNVTRGGNVFVARWASRYTETLNGGVFEGDKWEDRTDPDDDDTASIAAGYSRPTALGTTASNSKSSAQEGVSTECVDFNECTVVTANGGSTGAYVTDVGGGRYDVTTDTISGYYWLEIGVIEPGGLWGTYYESGGDNTKGKTRTPEAKWRTKGSVDFDWGFASPQEGVDDSGVSQTPKEENSTEFFVASSNLTVSGGPNRITASSLAWTFTSFPVDYFSARFSGFVKAEVEGEYSFTVITDRSSRVALSVSGQALFDDLQPAAPEHGAIDVAVAKSKTRTEALERRGRVMLPAGELVALQLHYAHTMQEAFVQLKWFDRTGISSGIVPATNLYHQRPGWKIAVDLHPAPTSPGTSTVIWPAKTTPEYPATDVTLSVGRKVVIAGQTLEIVAEARDAYGNHRGIGGDTVQAYAIGPGGMIFHGSVVDEGNGNYTLSSWPAIAGAYQMSLLISPLEQSRWALGYRNVEQALVGAHVAGSPFQVLVVAGEVAANASLAYGLGIASSVTGAPFGTSDFIIRARDAMGNRVSTGRTGVFHVEVFQDPEAVSLAGNEVGPVSVAVGTAVYTDKGGEYEGGYNVTVAGYYALHVTLSGGGEHIAGSPFALHVSVGLTSAKASMCDNCDKVFSAEGVRGNSSVRTLRLSARDAFDNAHQRGGEEWYVTLSGEDAGIPAVGEGGYRHRRHPVVADMGDGSYKFAIRPGVSGLYRIQVLLLSRANLGDAAGGSGSRRNFGGGGLTAHYYANVRFDDPPLVTRVDPLIRLDWGSRVPNDVSGLGSTGVSIGVRWDGFLKARLSETFTFQFSTGPGDEVRLWLDEELIIDKTSTSFSTNLVQPASLPDETVAGEASLVAGAVVRLRAEYLHHGGVTAARVAGRPVRVILEWESAGTPAQAVPSFALYPKGEEIRDSPFDFGVVDSRGSPRFESHKPWVRQMHSEGVHYLS